MSIKKIFLIICLASCFVYAVKPKKYGKTAAIFEKIIEKKVRRKRIFHNLLWGNREYLNMFPEDKDLYLECAKQIFGSFQTVDNREMFYIFEITAEAHNEKLIKAIEYENCILNGWETIRRIQRERSN